MMDAAVDPRQVILENSAVLLRRFSRMPSGLNIVTSWFTDAVEGTMTPETLLENQDVRNDDRFASGCLNVQRHCKFVAAELKLINRLNERPNQLVPQDSKALGRLMDVFSGMMPKSELLIDVANYFESKASEQVREMPHFKALVAAKENIVAAKQDLGEDIAPGTPEAMADLARRSRIDPKPETNSPIHPRSETSEPSEILLLSLDARATEVYRRIMAERLAKPEEETEKKKATKVKKGSDIEKGNGIDMNAPFDEIAGLVERMPEVFALLADKDVRTPTDLQNFMIEIIQTNRDEEADAANANSNDRKMAGNNMTSFISGKVVHHGGTRDGQLTQTALHLAGALEIAPAVAYRNFEFKESKTSQSLNDLHRAPHTMDNTYSA